MNKLYILGALAISSTNAYWAGATSGTTATWTVAGSALGAYSYTMSADCFSTLTATAGTMFTTYHEYFSFTLAAGTAIYATIPAVTSTYAYNACYHQHLYNWMA